MMFLEKPTQWSAKLVEGGRVVLRVDGANGKYVEFTLDEQSARAMHQVVGDQLAQINRKRGN